MTDTANERSTASNDTTTETTDDGTDRHPPVRRAGVLLHPTSLPGPHGIGDLGDEAYRFVDWLAAAKQTLWQILPLGPTGYGDSPYAAFSAFAGNALLISLERLADDGLLDASELRKEPPAGDRVDYDAVSAIKLPLLRVAAERFHAGQAKSLRAEYERFQQEQAGWLDDYTLFMALRAESGDQSWAEWPEELRLRDPRALADARERLKDTIATLTFMQFVFFRQWSELKRYANAKGIQIFGDVPIFVALDSADAWANAEGFQLDEQGRPIVVAGVPPDYFSETGQLWGNPLYDWDGMAKDGYRWWIERFRSVYSLVDIARIDHFRAFQAYWAVSADEETAINGEWRPSPGRELFAAVRKELGDVPIIAEDLGMITKDVDDLREELGFPGMTVLQFAFGSGPENLYLPHNVSRDTVVYTGTHDNDTTVGWYTSADEKTRDHVRSYLRVSGDDIAWDLIRAAWAATGTTAIVPAQDLLSLPGECRMNVPGAAHGNWGWRMEPGALTSEIARRLRDLTELYGRLGRW